MSTSLSECGDLSAEALEEEDPQDDLLAELGLRIVRLRTQKGWSRGDLAKRLGIARPRIGNWERGANAPPFEMLPPLGRVLGVSIDELVTGVAPAGKRLAPGDREAVTRHLEALCGLLT